MIFCHFRPGFPFSSRSSYMDHRFEPRSRRSVFLVWAFSKLLTPNCMKSRFQLVDNEGQNTSTVAKDSPVVIYMCHIYYPLSSLLHYHFNELHDNGAQTFSLLRILLEIWSHHFWFHLLPIESLHVRGYVVRLLVTGETLLELRSPFYHRRRRHHH